MKSKWHFGAYSILLAHILLTIFVVFTPFIVVLGLAREWQGIQDGMYRHIHMATVTYIAVEVILNVPCPLVTWENYFRKRANMPLYTKGFWDYWAEALLQRPSMARIFNMIFGGIFVLSVVLYLQLLASW